MAFGKPGRPPEDRLLRQREIYQAVAPLILERGVCNFTMEEAAYAACLSVGGLYHYFPSKRDLVLYAFAPEAMERYCRDLNAGIRHLAERDPEQYLDCYIDEQIEMIFFILPAMRAALELDVDDVYAAVESGMSTGQEEFLTALRTAIPNAHERDLDGLSRAIRRLFTGALFEREPDRHALKRELLALIDGHLSGDCSLAVASSGTTSLTVSS